MNSIDLAPAKKGKPWYRQKDFWLGIGLFYGIYLGLGMITSMLSMLLTSQLNSDWAVLASLPLCLNCLSFPGLFGLALYLKPRRPWFALGIVIGCVSALIPPILLSELLY
jgi:hypothetical protein